MADQRRILREVFTNWNGREVDTQGDSFFVAFSRATQAVCAAAQAQHKLAEHAWPQGVAVRVRMGIHTGEPWNGEEGYVGMDVHRAARIAHVGHGGQVLLSETTTALVRDELPAGVSLVDLARHILKDINRPERISQLVIEGLPAEFPPLTSLKTLPPEGTCLGVLVILNSDDPALLNQHIEIVNLITHLGRNTDNQIIFPKDSPVSRHHAYIEARAGQLFLGEVVAAEEHAGQPNRPVYGTFVNGEQVQEPVLLRDGDEIRLGKRLRMRFEGMSGRPDNIDRTLDQLDTSTGDKTIPSMAVDKSVITIFGEEAMVSNAENKSIIGSGIDGTTPCSSDDRTIPAFAGEKLMAPSEGEKTLTSWSKSGIIPTLLPGLRIGVATDPGLQRRAEPNQDAVLVIPPENGHPALFMVADGMGGYAEGEAASRLVVKAVTQQYRQAGKIEDLPSLICECLQNAVKILEKHVTGHPELSSMGSTAVLAILMDEQVVIANVGDSRAYRIYYASTPPQPTVRRFSQTSWLHRDKQTLKDQEPAVKIQQLSYDHSVVADMVRSGLLTPLQALKNPARNRLTQAITPKTAPLKPFITQLPFGAEDTLLLCSDGLWGIVPEDTLAAIALELTPQAAANKLVQQAISYGGPDNISVIIARRSGEKLH